MGLSKRRQSYLRNIAIAREAKLKRIYQYDDSSSLEEPPVEETSQGIKDIRVPAPSGPSIRPVASTLEATDGLPVASHLAHHRGLQEYAPGSTSVAGSTSSGLPVAETSRQTPGNQLAPPLVDGLSPSGLHPVLDVAHFLHTPGDAAEYGSTGLGVTDTNSLDSRRIVEVSPNAAIPVETASQALERLKLVLQPHRANRPAGKTPKMDHVSFQRINMMVTCLRLYCESTHDWTLIQASEIAAFGAGFSKPQGREIRHHIRAFISTGSLPENHYGAGNTSMIYDKELASALRLHLQSKGEARKAQDIVTYLEDPEVRARFKLEEPPSLRTAQRWLHHIMSNLDERAAPVPELQVNINDS